MLAIYKRELRSYFCSMIGFVYTAVVLAFIGYYFMAINLYQGSQHFSYALMSSVLIFVFAVPILTMKSFAEERRSKTDQMLLTYPVTVTSIVIGKYLAMMTVFAVPLLITCICPLIVKTGGVAFLASDYICIAFVLLLGFLYVAIGMFVSCLTEHQILSVFITLISLLILYLWDNIIAFIPNTSSASVIGIIIIWAVIVFCVWRMSKSSLAAIITAVVGIAAVLICYYFKPDMFSNLLPSLLGTFSINLVLYNFCYYNIFDLSGLFMCLSIAAVFVFLTIQTIQKRRWS